MTICFSTVQQENKNKNCSEWEWHKYALWNTKYLICTAVNFLQEHLNKFTFQAPNPGFASGLASAIFYLQIVISAESWKQPWRLEDLQSTSGSEISTRKGSNLSSLHPVWGSFLYTWSEDLFFTPITFLSTSGKLSQHLVFDSFLCTQSTKDLFFKPNLGLYNNQPC